MLAIALFVVVGTAALGFRFTIVRRLNRLRATIRAVIVSGQRTQMTQTGHDELGQVMSTFNEVMSREERQERDLRRSNKALDASRSDLLKLNQELEARVQASEQALRFQDFAASAADWQWEMDANLRFSFFSERFTEITGVEQEVLLGKTRQETGIPDVDPDICRKHLDDLANQRAFRNFNHPRVKADGSVIWLAINGTPVFNDDGHFAGYRGTGSDVTERIDFQEKPIEAKERSEQEAKSRGQFLANMSHEIRAPMNGVLGMSELLLDCDLPTRPRHLASVIRDSASAFLSLINGILDLSKIDSGKTELAAVTLSLRQLVEGVAILMCTEADSRQSELRTTIDNTVPQRMVGDPARLRQVLVNLIGNGLKFTKRGSVELTLRAGSTDPELTSLHFEVKDSGIGIEGEALGGVFEDFCQADGSTTRHCGGTGLGLSISKHLVELMGGTMTVSSDQGVGSTFRFMIRAAVPQTAAVAGENASDNPVQRTRDRLAGLRVLVAEDHEANQLLVREMLTPMGCNVTIVDNGLAAIDTALTGAFDVVLMDWQMPELDGLEATRRIREYESQHAGPGTLPHKR